MAAQRLLSHRVFSQGAPRQGAGRRAKGDTLSTTSRMIRAACATAIAAFGLTGCTPPTVHVTDETAAQAGQIGDTVRVDAAFCVDAGADGTCATLERGKLPVAGGQLLAAFLVPASASAPATATADPAGAAPAVTLARSTSYASALQAARPAPEGRRWVGYVSDVLTPDEGAVGAFTAAADFGIARGSGGMPQPATFAYAVAGGIRLADWQRDDLRGDRPVDCDEERTFGDDDEKEEDTVPTTVCGATSAGGEVALRDLRGAGATVSAAPGTEVAVPFTLRYVGAPGPAFALHATTELPDAAATTDVPVLTPDTGFVDVRVRIAVPVGTAPGEYIVALTATTGGQERRALGTLVVTGAAAGDPSRPPALVEGEDQVVDGAGTPSASAAAGGIVAPAGGWRFLDFTAVSTAGLDPDGRSVTAGEVACHKLVDYCWPVAAKLLVRADELGASAPGRMVVAGRISGAVPPQGRRSLVFSVGPRVRRLLAAGTRLDALVTVRAGSRSKPIVRPLLLHG